MTHTSEECFEELKKGGLMTALKLHPKEKIKTVFDVISEFKLRAISSQLPSTRKDLLAMKLLSKTRMKEYEVVILVVTNKYAEDQEEEEE